MAIGSVMCKHCGTMNAIHPFDLFPGIFLWGYQCAKCRVRSNLPFVPTVTGFFLGFFVAVQLARSWEDVPFAIIPALIAGCLVHLGFNAAWYRVFR